MVGAGVRPWGAVWQSRRMTDFLSSSGHPSAGQLRPDARLVGLHAERGDPHARLSAALADLEDADWGLLLAGEAALARQLAALLGPGTLRVDGRLDVDRAAMAAAGLAVADLHGDLAGARAAWLLEPDERVLERARRAGVRVIVDGTLAPGGGWPRRGADYVVYRDGVTLCGHVDAPFAALFGSGQAPASAAPAPSDLGVALALRDAATLPLRLARAARTVVSLTDRLGGAARPAGPTALLLAPDAAPDSLSVPGGVLAATRHVPDGLLLTPGLEDTDAVLARLRSGMGPAGRVTAPQERAAPAGPGAGPGVTERAAAEPRPVQTAEPAPGTERPAETAPEEPRFGRRDERRDRRFEGRRDERRRFEGRRFESRPDADVQRGERGRSRFAPGAESAAPDQARPDTARADSAPIPGAAPERFTFEAPSREEAAPEPMPRAAAPAVPSAPQGPGPQEARPTEAQFATPAPAQDEGERWEPEIVFSSQGQPPVPLTHTVSSGPDAPDLSPAQAHAAQADDAAFHSGEVEGAGNDARPAQAPERPRRGGRPANGAGERGQPGMGQPSPAQPSPAQPEAPLLAPDLPVAAAAEGKADPAADLSDEQTAIYARLREWRNAEARRQEISRFIIASNATLAEIARRVPYTPEDLRAVRGMGPERSRKYGDKILEVVRG